MYDRLYLEYSALDVDSELKNVEFRFRNENGNEISLSDSDDDGIATRTVESWYSEGTYNLNYIRLSDRANDDNVIYYRKDGTTDFMTHRMEQLFMEIMILTSTGIPFLTLKSESHKLTGHPLNFHLLS